MLLAVTAMLFACERGPRELVLASTTSTEDSGLFDTLIPAFEQAHPEYAVKVIAVGSGQALELGRRKDADVLLVHAPLAEIQFVEAGYGELRRDVMYNDFVIVGPSDDPASLGGPMSALEGLRRISALGGPFVSRGDDSGTHRKERALWQAAGVRPDPRWHMEVGQGMAEALRIASERQAYALTDRATYLSLRDGLNLEILLEGDQMLYNPYGVIVVAGARNVEGARVFADWITGDAGQQRIGAFGQERFGRSLFIPNAAPPDR
ncbi:MAG: substrate-binding domain-containing protein [Longimicrobiales bacterium]